MMEFEKVFPELCAFGKYQKLIFFFVLLPAQLSYYLHIYSHIFMTYQPPHWCKIDHLVDSVVSSSQSSLRHQHNRAVQSLDMTPWFQSGSLRNNEMLQRYFFIPSKLDHQVDSHLVNMSDLLFRMNYSLVNYVESLSSCTVFNASSEQLAPFQHGLFQLFLLVLLSNRTANEVVLSSQLLDKAQNLIVSPPAVACTEWTFNRTWFGADESIVTRWNLVCAQEWTQLMALSALLVGLFFSFPLCYFLTHSFGHRRTYFVMLLSQCAAGTLSAFVVDFAHFCLLRFVIGLSLATITVVPTDLMVQMSGVRVMEQVVLYSESIRLLGGLVLALVAHFIHDYRHLSIAISAPFIVFVFFWWSFPESTNHLLVSGQIGRLEKFVLDIAHTNLAFFDAEFDESIKRRIYIELAIYRELLISSLVADSFARLDQYISYIDFDSAGAEEAAMMLKDCSPYPVAVPKSCEKSTPQESTLVHKLTQHLEKRDSISQKLPHKMENGKVPTPVELWSEPNSDTEVEKDKAPVRPHISNGHVQHQVIKGPKARCNSGRPVPVSEQRPAGPQGVLREGSTLCAILALPNMRRKLFVLLFLSATHISIYINFTYFIEDFVGNQPDRKVQLRPSSLHNMFAFAMALNLVSVALCYLCLHYKLGRKLTFLLTNLLASIFTLVTGLSMGSQLGSETSNKQVDFDEWRSHANASIVLYSIAKVFQASTYLILLVWLYELLPPIADCSVALHACFIVANLQLLVMPLLIFAAKKWLRLSFYLPDVVAEVLRQPESANLPLHYLYCVVLLSLSGLLCLLLPETGSLERLPYSLQEAELFQPFATLNASSGPERAKWYSLKVLFNFEPPNIRPISGILKKPQVSQVRANGKVRSGKKKFLHNSLVEERIASMSKDCANKTAINSLYNRFSSGNGRPVAYELSYPKQCKGASNGRHQSDWMSAVADAAATGVPLFVPVPSPTRTNSDQAKQTLGRLGDLSSPSVEIEDHRRLHETGLMTTTRKGHNGTLSMETARRHSIEDDAIMRDDNYYQPHHHAHQQSIACSKDWKMAHKTGSNAELTYMAAVMDFPYHQNRFQSLPRVNALPPLELWDDLTNEEQIVQWINHTNWSAQAQHSPNGFASNHPIGNNKVRVLDIVDTNRGVSGQIDTYLDPESSYYPGSGSLTQPEQALPPDTSRANVMINNSQPMDSINDLPDFGLVEDEVHFTDTPSLCHSFEVDNPSAFLALDL